MQPATDASVLGDCNRTRFSNKGLTSIFLRDGRRFMVHADGPDGSLHDYEIKYTFGVSPLQQYLIQMPRGRLQALGIACDSRPSTDGGHRWFSLYPNERINFHDSLHWTGSIKTGTSCAQTAIPPRSAGVSIWRHAHTRLHIQRSRWLVRPATDPGQITSRGQKNSRVGKASRAPRECRSRWMSAATWPGASTRLPAMRIAVRHEHRNGKSRCARDAIRGVPKFMKIMSTANRSAMTTALLF